MSEPSTKNQPSNEVVAAAVVGAVSATATAAITGLIRNLPKIILKSRKELKTGSLIEYTKNTRVEPMVLLDDSLRLQPYMPDIMDSVVNIFCGYYLQAVAITANVGNIEVKRLLNKLNPDRVRSPTDAALDLLSIKYHEGMELYIDSLEQDYTEQEKAEDRQMKKEERKDREEERREQREERETDFSASVSRQSIDDFNTNANLSMGKMINVEIESDGKSANIPVNVRLIVKPVPANSLVHFLTAITSDRSARTRWKRWKGGEIEFFRDLLLCQDIIDEEKKAHYSDKTGIFRQIRARNRSKNNNIYDIATNEINVATASSIIIISRDTANDIERTLMGRLDHFKTREDLFKITFTMIMLVVDIRWEKIIMYHRSIDEPSILSVKDFKSKSKGSGPDINEILMAYRAGTAPTF